MAMNKTTVGLTFISDLIDELQNGQTLFQRKSNTVTSVVGTIITILLAAGTAWVDAVGDTGAPSWLPLVIGALGMLATTFGISKTPNGVTDSLADRIHDAVADRIDQNHIHVDPPTLQMNAVNPLNAAMNLRAMADGIVSDLTSGRV